MDANLETCRRVGKGLVELDLSFLTNNASNPSLSTLRGVGTEMVDAITYSTTGILIVTLKLSARCRYVVQKLVELEDLDSSDDGAYASAGPVNNEGSSTTKMNFKVYTRAAGGTKTNYSNRRVHVRLVLKNSTVGV